MGSGNVSIFSKLKTKGHPAENPPQSDFSVKSNGPELSEDLNPSNDTDVLNPRHNRRAADKNHSSNDERGRRTSDHIRHLINKILSGQSIGQGVIVKCGVGEHDQAAFL